MTVGAPPPFLASKRFPLHKTTRCSVVYYAINIHTKKCTLHTSRNSFVISSYPDFGSDFFLCILDVTLLLFFTRFFLSGICGVVEMGVL